MFGSLIEPRMILGVEILVVTEGIAGNLSGFVKSNWGEGVSGRGAVLFV
jgi:hypothetical protein